MVLNYLDTSFLAPYYLPEPISNAVERKLRKFRTKEMDEADARRAMGALDRHVNSSLLRMASIHELDVRQATEWILNLRMTLRATDAIHLAVAVRHNAVLWTLDKGLADAAQAVGLLTKK